MAGEYDKTKFDWWKDSLAGKKPPMHADSPMQGYYAYRSSEKAKVQPVAFWYNANGEMLCKLGHTGVDYGLDIWMGAGRNPITHKVYTEVLGTGVWPHEIQIVTEDGKTQSTLDRGMGDNSGDKFTELKGDIENWAREAEKLKKKGPPENQTDADKMADVATKIADFQREADKLREIEKKPHWDAGKAVDAKWRPVIEKADIFKDLKALIDTFIRKENAKRAEEARKLQEKLNAEGAGETAGVTISTVRATAGTRKTVSSVKKKVVKFTDIKAAALFLASMEEPPVDFMDVLSKRCYQLMNAGMKVPGAELETVESAR